MAEGTRIIDVSAVTDIISLLKEYSGSVVADPLRQAEAQLALLTYKERLKSQDLSLSTVRKYIRCIDAYVQWLGDKTVSSETAEEFLGVLKGRNFTSATQVCYYHALKPFLKVHDIDFKAKFKKRKHLPTYHAVDDVKAILTAIETDKDKYHTHERDRLIVLLLAYTGMRRGELLNLRARDINFSSRMLMVRGKGDKDRTIPIADQIYDILLNYVHTSSSDRLIALQPKRLSNIVRRYARLARIENFHTHSSRHFFATQLIEKGVNLKVVQELLGHEDISTTALYLDVLPKHLSEAVNRLDLGGTK